MAVWGYVNVASKTLVHLVSALTEYVVNTVVYCFPFVIENNDKDESEWNINSRSVFRLLFVCDE